jgi:hypothetical protein
VVQRRFLRCQLVATDFGRFSRRRLKLIPSALELYWTDVIDGRVASLAVVEPFEVVEYIGLCLAHRGICLVVSALNLERFEETAS